MESDTTRRDFLKSAAKTTAGLGALGGITFLAHPERVFGANDRVRVAVCGLHGRGKDHLSAFSHLSNVEIAALCDVDENVLRKRLGEVSGKPQSYVDVRKLLEDNSIDAISIATPNHWHSLLTIWACQAGKDVYVEKPLSHDLTEGRRCIQAARKYGRIVQHGTQQRSSESRANEIAAVQSGKYGRLLVSKGYCCKPRWSIGRKPYEAPPRDLAFDLWLGPATLQPYHGNLVHYNWHWFWDFGNGDIGNQGVHEIDVARWAIKGATLPTKVWSLGGRFAYEDQGQTPNMQMTVFEYGDTLLVFEVRGLVDKPKDSPFKFKVANEYYTSDGMITEGKFYPKGSDTPEKLAHFDVRVTPGGAWGSFLHAVRSRKIADCNADVEVGHLSCVLVHAANVSYRLGEKVPFDAKSQK